MANITKAERERRASEASAREDDDAFGARAHISNQDQLRETNECDERALDRRPSTVVDLDTQEAAPDNRQFSDTLGKAVNQMTGRAAVTENHDPKPAVTLAERPPEVVASGNPVQASERTEEVQLLRGYVPEGGMPDGQFKHVKGEVVYLPRKEAKKLVNLGAARFTAED